MPGYWVSLATKLYISAFLLAWLMSGNLFRSSDPSLVITWQRLGYIKSRFYILYLYVFVPGPWCWVTVFER